MINVKKDDSMIFWKCPKCGYVYTNDDLPESCIICDTEKNKFQKVDQKEFLKTMENFDISKRKKKYRRVFKKGFARKYKKYLNRW